MVEQVSAKAYWNRKNARIATPVRPVGFRCAVQEEELVADEAVPRAEHEREAPGPEQNAAEAGVDDPLEEDVHRLARPGEPGLEEHEPRLHEEHEERRDERPHRVDRVDVRRRRRCGVIREGLVPEVVRDSPDDQHEEREPQRLAAEERVENTPSLSGLHSFHEPFDHDVPPGFRDAIWAPGDHHAALAFRNYFQTYLVS